MTQNPERIFDEFLVLKVQSGDNRAMDLLVKRWYPRISRHINRYIHETEVTKDLTQECWIVIMKNISQLRNPAAFPSWALRIAGIKAIDWIRDIQKERKISEEFNQNSNEEIHDDEMMTLLRKSLRDLPENQRMVLSLFYLEKMSLQQISSILDVPTGTVKSRMFHAREQLKKLIKEYRNEN